MLNDQNNFLFKILVVDTDPYIRQILKQKLLFPNYQILFASDGPEAIVSIRNEQPDLVILDLMLPNFSGYKICNEVKKNSNTPIMLLTPLAALSDHIFGFKIGVDDYILKPFILEKFEIRVHTLLYRSYKISKHSFFHTNKFLLQAGSFKLNIINQCLVTNETQIRLTQTEFNLLTLLIKHIGQIVTREIIFDHVWGYMPDHYNDLRLVDVYIFRLRAKFKKSLKASHFIYTVRGTGYVLQKE